MLEQRIRIWRKLLRARATGAECGGALDFSAAGIAEAEFAADAFDAGCEPPELIGCRPANDGSWGNLAFTNEGQKGAAFHSRRGGIAGLHDIPGSDPSAGGLTGHGGVFHLAAGTGTVGFFGDRSAEWADGHDRSRRLTGVCRAIQLIRNGIRARHWSLLKPLAKHFSDQPKSYATQRRFPSEKMVEGRLT